MKVCPQLSSTQIVFLDETKCCCTRGMEAVWPPRAPQNFTFWEWFYRILASKASNIEARVFTEGTWRWSFHPRTTKEAHIPVPIGLNITSFKEDGETQIESLRCIWRTSHTTLKRNSIGSVSLWIINIRNCFYTRKCFTFGPPTCSRVRAQKSSFWEALLESVTVNQTLI